MVGELSIPGGIAATTVADATAGDVDALGRETVGGSTARMAHFRAGVNALRDGP
jgi:hypothetical protein